MIKLQDFISRTFGAMLEAENSGQDVVRQFQDCCIEQGVSYLQGCAPEIARILKTELGGFDSLLRATHAVRLAFAKESAEHVRAELSDWNIDEYISFIAEATLFSNTNDLLSLEIEVTGLFVNTDTAIFAHLAQGIAKDLDKIKSEGSDYVAQELVRKVVTDMYTTTFLGAEVQKAILDGEVELVMIKEDSER